MSINIKRYITIIGVIFLIIVTVIAIVYAIYGGFSKINLKKERLAPIYGISLRKVGNYSSTSSYIRALEIKAKAKNIITLSGFGIFYDNPKVVQVDSLRALIGLIIEDSEIEKAADLGDSSDLINLPEMEAYTVTFPYKGPLSFIIAIGKIYPALQKACGDNRSCLESPTIEIFSKDSKEIKFILPISVSKEQLENLWYNDSTNSTDTQEDLSE